MAWNEPGNGQRDPWKKRPAGSGKPNLKPLLDQLKKRFGGLGGGPGGVITVLLAVILAALLLSSYTIINARQAGVVERFGRYTRTLTPGFHLKWPRPIETVTKVETTQVRSMSDQVRMLTRDENIISVDFNVQYQVADARQFLFRVRDPEDALRQAAEAAVRAVVGGSTMDSILTSAGSDVSPAAVGSAPAPATLPDQTRDTLQQQTREALQAMLDSYGTGIVINDVSFQNVAPPQEVRAAFDDVNAAREDKLATENQARAYASQVIPVAKGAAARILAEAQGYQAERVARANGDAQRFNLILKEYKAAPEVTRRRLWLETVEDVMSHNPKVLDGSGGRNVLYLPLNQLDAKSVPGLGQVAPAVETDAAKEKQP